VTLLVRHDADVKLADLVVLARLALVARVALARENVARELHRGLGGRGVVGRGRGRRRGVRRVDGRRVDGLAARITVDAHGAGDCARRRLGVSARASQAAQSHRGRGDGQLSGEWNFDMNGQLTLWQRAQGRRKRGV
jgi:hypothetical protein